MPLTASSRLHLIASASLLLLAGCEANMFHEEGRELPPPTPDASLESGPMRTPPPTPPAAVEIPCEVEAVLAQNCGTCHGESPMFGAPSSLTEMTHFLTGTASGEQMSEAVLRRIHDPHSPMPPVTQPDMSEEDKNVLTDWIEAGLPAREAGVTCDPIEPPCTDPPCVDELDCEISHRFLAGNSATEEPYPVPSGGGDPNSYVCFPIENPFFGTSTQATAWAPVIDNAEVLHHWILWGSNQPARGSAPIPCEVLPTSDAEFVTGWAPGGQPVVLPDDVGLDMQYRTFYLQLHYWNPSGTAGLTDRSGVAFCTTPTPRANAAGVLTLGDAGLRIPPRSRGVEENFVCPAFRMPGGGDFTILSSGPHMHQLATSFLSEVIRSDGSRTELGRIDAWSFDDQVSIPMEPSVRVNPGDRLSITCRYDNPTDRFVGFGEGSEDEMCFDFLLVYPVDRMPVGGRKCIGIF